MTGRRTSKSHSHMGSDHQTITPKKSDVNKMPSIKFTFTILCWLITDIISHWRNPSLIETSRFIQSTNLQYLDVNIKKELMELVSFHRPFSEWNTTSILPRIAYIFSTNFKQIMPFCIIISLFRWCLFCWVVVRANHTGRERTLTWPKKCYNVLIDWQE
jgi:hypothetical protein